MIPYLLALIIPMMFLYLVDSHQIDVRIGFVLTSVAIAFPCILAGARDSGIGMDTLGYGDLIFELALANRWDWLSFIDAVRQSGFDIGFAFSAMAYVVVGMSSSSFWYYFVIEALIIVPCYFGVRLLAPGDNRAVSYASLYLILYMLSLSAMRQFIALAFGFLSVAVFMARGNTGKGLIACILLEAISISFHKSAAFIIVCHIFWLCAAKYNDGVPLFREHTLRTLPLICVLVVFCAFNIDPIFRFVTSVVPFFSRYASYLVTSGTASGFTFFIFFGMMLIATIIRGRYLLLNHEPKFIMLLFCGFVSVVLYALQSYNEEFIRLSYYFWPYICASFSMAIGSGKKIRTRKGRLIDLFASITFVIFIIGQFAWWYIINDYYECLPYTSEFLCQLIAF